MNSPLLALLLIVNLLACPVRCLSCDTNGAAGEQSVQAACSCCPLGEDIPASEAPGPDGDDCSCQNCLCAGAVSEADLELPDSVRSFEMLVWPTLSGNDSAAFPGGTLSRGSLGPSGNYLGGRAIRLAHQSWLI